MWQNHGIIFSSPSLALAFQEETLRKDRNHAIACLAQTSGQKQLQKELEVELAHAQDALERSSPEYPDVQLLRYRTQCACEIREKLLYGTDVFDGLTPWEHIEEETEIAYRGIIADATIRLLRRTKFALLMRDVEPEFLIDIAARYAQSKEGETMVVRTASAFLDGFFPAEAICDEISRIRSDIINEFDTIRTFVRGASL